MKKLSILVFSLFLIVVMGGAVNAALYTHTYNPTDIFLMKYEKPSFVEWWAYITPAYNPSTEYVTAAYLDLYLRGDGDSYPEKGKLLVSTDYKLEQYIDNPNIDQAVTLDVGLAYLQDGNTLFKLIAIEGDFWFEKATLRAFTSPVPEPGTMLLLGAGLLGLAGYGRRKFNK